MVILVNDDSRRVHYVLILLRLSLSYELKFRWQAIKFVQDLDSVVCEMETENKELAFTELFTINNL